jgi:hypothetical protein
VRLGDLDALKDNMFNYAAPEMMWDRGDIEHKIDEQPTISAIPVEWLKEQISEAPDSLWASLIKSVMNQWKKEQEAR